MRPASVLVPEWSWLPPFLLTVRVGVGAQHSGLTDLTADRRRSLGKGRSPARLSPQAGDRKGARRWLVLRFGYLPGEYPAHTAARSRSRLPFSTQAARASSSEHNRTGSRRRHVRSVLPGRIPRHNRRLPRRNGRESWLQNPEARRRPAASRSSRGRRGGRLRTSPRPFPLPPKEAGRASPESRDLTRRGTGRERPPARPAQQ